MGTAASGAGLWGQLDLAGEVFEWNLDWYAGYTACADCADVSIAPGYRVIRGSDFVNTSSDLLPPRRYSEEPWGRLDSYGFRCARTP